MDTQKTFEALPHINKVWVSEDGEFSLYERENCELILRHSDEIPQANEPIEKKITSQAKANKKVK